MQKHKNWLREAYGVGENTICDFCKHKQPEEKNSATKWCSLAALTYGSDGYGPWFSGAGCKHDPRIPKLEDKFEPLAESEVKEYHANYEALGREIDSLKYENKRLKQRFQELAELPSET